MTSREAFIAAAMAKVESAEDNRFSSGDWQLDVSRRLAEVRKLENFAPLESANELEPIGTLNKRCPVFINEQKTALIATSDLGSLIAQTGDPEAIRKLQVAVARRLLGRG